MERTVYTIGEALIDFFPEQKDTPLKNVTSFTKQPGGAPANVAVTVAKLGGQAKFIGKLGKDAFGDFLTETLQLYNVDTEHIFRTTKANTALAFVSLEENGERDFSFYRKPSADMLLHADEVADIPFKSSDILHFCSIDLIEADVKYAHKKVIENMKKIGGTISFDPNVRLNLWENADDLKNTIIGFLPYTDILKVSDDEILFISGKNNEADAIDWFLEFPISLLIITRGSRGSSLYVNKEEIFIPGIKKNAVDTTGAGDSYIGAFLYMYANQPFFIQECSNSTLKSMAAFSNIVSALVVTRTGGMSSIPNLKEIEQYFN